MIKIGDRAPDFSLKADDGKTYSLSKLKGKRIVLYFYPKDNTPGCTLEGCSFRDNLYGFKAKNAVVLGVSADSVESHRKFSSKFRFNFPLLADAGGTVSRKYGVWKERSFLGKKFTGIERSTFVIDEAGKIGGIFLRVNPLNHATGILNAISMLRPAAAKQAGKPANTKAPKTPANPASKPSKGNKKRG